MKVIIIHVRETQRDRLKDSKWERRKCVSIRDSEGVYLCDAWFKAGLCKFSLAGPVKQNVFLMKLDEQAYQHLMLRHPKQRTLYINILTVAPLDEG